MNGPIIAIDVSKDSSHIQAFYDLNKKFSKVIEIKHDKDGLAYLLSLISELFDTTNKEVSVVFEATGVYHKVIQRFLKENDVTFFMISPLMSAKFRQTELHANKTDKLDPKHIAKVYYNVDFLREYILEEDFYLELRKLNRYYEDCLVHLRKYKVQFKAMLEEIFPTFNSKYGTSDIYIEVVLEIFKKYPHPELLIKANPESNIRLSSNTNHHRNYVKNKIIKMKNISESIYSGVSIDDEVSQRLFINTINNIQETNRMLESVLNDMIKLAKQLDSFEIIKSIVGIGENLAARIIAELGDLSKFNNKNQLISYAGLDPMIRQSGQRSGMGLSITKKGNKYLRCLLYLGVTFNYRLKKNDPLYLFNQKKRQQKSPLKPKAANIATAHKLLDIIYGMCNNGTLYQLNK